MDDSFYPLKILKNARIIPRSRFFPKYSTFSLFPQEGKREKRLFRQMCTHSGTDFIENTKKPLNEKI